MKKIALYKFISLIIFFFISMSIISNGGNKDYSNPPYIVFIIPDLIKINEIPLYENIWGSIYHAEESQCDDTPFITANGSRINPLKASNHRWIAISQEMIDDEYRAKLIKSDDPRFKGKIKYGDTVWIDSPYSEINGWWVVCDAKNKRYTKSIDFLQTIGDKTLIKNYPRWPGKFENIKICRFGS